MSSSAREEPDLTLSLIEPAQMILDQFSEELGWDYDPKAGGFRVQFGDLVVRFRIDMATDDDPRGHLSIFDGSLVEPDYIPLSFAHYSKKLIYRRIQFNRSTCKEVARMLDIAREREEDAPGWRHIPHGTSSCPDCRGDFDTINPHLWVRNWAVLCPQCCIVWLWNEAKQ